MSDLKFKTNRELRRDIAYTVGGDPTRYADSKHLNKADLMRLAETLDVERAAEMNLDGLYEAICESVGQEWTANAGHPWGINRDNLKAIHRTIDASSPREVINA